MERSPIFDAGMTILECHPENYRRAVAPPAVEGDACRRCGGTSWTFWAEATREYRQDLRCVACGYHRRLTAKEKAA